MWQEGKEPSGHVSFHADEPSQQTLHPQTDYSHHTQHTHRARRWPHRLALLFLCLLHAWYTLYFFQWSWGSPILRNEEPIVSGQHALHQYHGQMGASSWWERSQESTFDPGFMAGYPKTPIFDSGCRPAELSIFLFTQRPYAAYKIGFFGFCLLAPLLFWGMARGLELSRTGCFLCALLGTMIWWNRLNVDRLRDGEWDLLGGSVASFLHCCWLIRYSHRPTLSAWGVLFLSASLAWSIQPVFFLVFTPAIFLHYLWNTGRHDTLWHVSLWIVWLGAFGINSLWLSEWFQHLALLLPVMDEPLGPSAFAGFWRTWRDWVPTDPCMQMVAAGGILGLPVLAYRHFSAFSLLVLGTLCVGFAAHAHRVWPMMEELRLPRLLFILAWFGIFPLADSVATIARFVSQRLKSYWLEPIFVGGLFLAVVGVTGYEPFSKPLPLEIGWGEERTQLFEQLRQLPDGRILWEDLPGQAESRWSALLHKVTGKPFIGGLDPESRMEHFFMRLSSGRLAGRMISDWSDTDLDAYVQRFNITAIVSRSQLSTLRFQRWLKQPGEKLPGQTGLLFQLPRVSNYFLKGKGRIIKADWRSIQLADVEPVDGEIILSMHYQHGWQATPVSITIERQLDADDPIPMIRLRMNSALPRIVLEWQSQRADQNP